VDGFILRTNQKIRGRADNSHRGILCALFLAMLTAPAATALLSAPAFADVSPGFGNGAPRVNADDQPVQLAEANLPPIGSVDDYMREGNENGGGSSYQPQAVPPQAYQPQAMPPQGYYPQGAPQDWNNGYADPNAERNALIGAAVVGAVAVGLWAWQQHQMIEAQRHARKQFHSHRKAFD
jgi:hypothetical protein